MLRRSSIGSASAVSRPFTSTWPSSGTTRAFTVLSSVVFPQPELPMTVTNVPRGTYSDTSSSAIVSPKPLLTWSKRMAVSLRHGGIGGGRRRGGAGSGGGRGRAVGGRRRRGNGSGRGNCVPTAPHVAGAGMFSSYISPLSARNSTATSLGSRPRSPRRGSCGPCRRRR